MRKVLQMMLGIAFCTPYKSSLFVFGSYILADAYTTCNQCPICLANGTQSTVLYQSMFQNPEWIDAVGVTQADLAKMAAFYQRGCHGRLPVDALPNPPIALIQSKSAECGAFYRSLSTIFPVLCAVPSRTRTVTASSTTTITTTKSNTPGLRGSEMRQSGTPESTFAEMWKNLFRSPNQFKNDDLKDKSYNQILNAYQASVNV